MDGQFREIEHCWIPMPDGVRLSARIWLPHSESNSESVPTIVEYIPYRKRDMVRARDERNHPWFAAHGYACLRIDMRGSGDSEGLMPDMYHQNELDDAIRALEWIKKQNWCDGNIGMMGTSWGGTSALQAASRGSGLLQAVIAVCATNNRFDDDIHHMGGCLLTDSIEWGATLPAILALPPAPDSDPAGWRQNWQSRLAQIEFPLFSWIEHETRDEYWKHGAVNEVPGRLECPVLAIGGWSDRYSNTVMNLLTDNPDQCWGIVGPWGHHYPDQGVPGPAIGFQQEALRWWDFWLRGESNGVDQSPRLRVWFNQFQAPEDFFAFREGHWREFEHWPVTEASMEFDLIPQSVSESQRFQNIPFDLRVGNKAGDTGYFGRPGGLPLEQSEEDSRSLVFETPMLDKPLALLGKALVGLDLKVSSIPSQVVIRLCDVDSNGQVARVAWRVQNLALDDAGQSIDILEVDQTINRAFALPNAAHVFQPGHKIRVSISASYWPQIWPVPQQVDNQLDCQNVKLKIALAPENANSTDFSKFPESLTLVNRDPTSVVKSIQRESRWDGDVLVQRWHQPLALTKHNQMNIEIGAETTAEHRIDLRNPLSACSRFEHSLTAIHGDHIFTALGVAQVEASCDYYQVEGSLQVKENGDEVVSRNWSRKIPRRDA